MPRKPNAICEVCSTPHYRRPSQQYKHAYCSMKCFLLIKKRHEHKCKQCNKTFHPKSNTQTYCSKRCAALTNRKSINTKIVIKPKNLSISRLELLKSTYNFTSCMVEGCQYSTTYDIHRLVEGKNGGKYELGNMFAICPNHHAEYHRNIILFEKIDDCHLRAIRKV